MDYAVEVTSGGMIYTPSFMKIGIGVQKFLGGIQTFRLTDTHTHTYTHIHTTIYRHTHTGAHTHTHRQQGDLISHILFLAYFAYFKT
jgi:hypothetical protein